MNALFAFAIGVGGLLAIGAATLLWIVVASIKDRDWGMVAIFSVLLLLGGLAIGGALALYQ